MSFPAKPVEDDHVEYSEEREREEYIHTVVTPKIYSDHSASVQFLTDDRENDTEVEEYEKITVRRLREEIIKDSATNGGRWTDQRVSRDKTLNWEPLNRPSGGPSTSTSTYKKLENYNKPREVKVKLKDMSVDYSPTDFEESRARIDAASRQSNVKVKKVGDTTIISEHRDPYSFYWQLDQFKKKEPEPPRRPPPTDYVIDEEEVQEPAILSPDSGVNFVERESQYSRPFKDEVRRLPAGWEKHEDPSGFSYYWHVDSGTIQREPPLVSNKPKVPTPPSPVIYAEKPPKVYEPLTVQPPPPLAPSPAPPAPSPQPVIEEHAFKQVTTKRTVENHDENEDFIDADIGVKSSRFMVRSLGWVPIPEEELTTERSSRAVNNAIKDLSKGTRGNIPKWGDGKELIMELNDNELLLIDPETNKVVHSEKIQYIRVWGVGKDNGRDFAFVARDRSGKGFLCHVFRCDTPARAIANTLRDICKQLVQIKDNRDSRPFSPLSENSERRLVKSSHFTPIDEVRKVIRCHFIGVTEVPRATGIDILNDAVNRLVAQVRPEKWVLADVSIALSTITITEVNGEQVGQCRVRYLSFLGIGQDIKHCAFIMHTSTENFLCYVFHVEPSAAIMAKTIESACKLRYQKVLDAHIGRPSRQKNY